MRHLDRRQLVRVARDPSRAAGRIAGLTLAMAMAGIAHAQTPPAGAASSAPSSAPSSPAATARAPADDSLFRALGGEAGITRITAGLVERVYADPRIKDLFQQNNPKYLAKQLSQQFCELTGGPCKFDGETMKNSHAHLGVDKAKFNALVENLQLSMDAEGVPFATQNRLLAILAPMHRDVITR